ncbi:hypothetical protein LBMAG56_41990 [Verrucomicrobiota bacterium]|nr:hypothetical protein LBMAG56_41990 [Verrucomicrobiota bacterium]
MSTASENQALFTLPVAERVALAAQLYASVPDDWQREADQAWLKEVEVRSAEMDAHPETEMSHEEFVAGIHATRRQA